MELHGSTFLLEIVNFLVLVWILKRFLYKPVQEAVRRRRETIEQTLADARAQQAAGEELQRAYANRLADWEREKQDARAALNRELTLERRQRTDALEAELAEQRHRAEILAQRNRRELQRQAEAEALRLGAAFGARLLQRLTGPELDAKLQALILEDLAALPEPRRAALRKERRNGNLAVEVTSPRKLTPPSRQGLEQVLAELLGGAVHCDYRIDPTLIGGVRLQLGAWTLGANLRDELAAFVEAGRG